MVERKIIFPLLPYQEKMSFVGKTKSIRVIFQNCVWVKVLTYIYSIYAKLICSECKGSALICISKLKKVCWEYKWNHLYNYRKNSNTLFYKSKRSSVCLLLFATYFIYETNNSFNCTLNLSISVSVAVNRGEKSTLTELTNLSFPTVQLSISFNMPAGILPFFRDCNLP